MDDAYEGKFRDKVTLIVTRCLLGYLRAQGMDLENEEAQIEATQEYVVENFLTYPMAASVNVSPLIAKDVCEQFSKANLKKSQKHYYCFFHPKGNNPKSVTLDYRVHRDAFAQLFDKWKEGDLVSNGYLHDLGLPTNVPIITEEADLTMQDVQQIKQKAVQQNQINKP